MPYFMPFIIQKKSRVDATQFAILYSLSAQSGIYIQGANRGRSSKYKYSMKVNEILIYYLIEKIDLGSI